MVWPSDLFPIILALFFGAVVGLEREIHGKSAGLRTNILICVGAAIFTMVSKQMAGASDSHTRIAAQVVTGVGFLGAGAIIQDRGGVHGLTTAASIWLVASIGMACGAHYYYLALVGTVLTIAVLLGLTPVTKAIYRQREKQQNVESNPDKDL
jgi:putative Mg2+ transporter-C (MgtC) family protein